MIAFGRPVSGLGSSLLRGDRRQLPPADCPRPHKFYTKHRTARGAIPILWEADAMSSHPYLSKALLETGSAGDFKQAGGKKL